MDKLKEDIDKYGYFMAKVSTGVSFRCDKALIV